ncbi:hypothetical protein [Neorhizobium sp. IRS_2294]|uniref:hypothetical protein n=1 Tax=unclassified Neorhizobium TaxID=2629175 RepID=UPI003D2E8B63
MAKLRKLARFSDLRQSVIDHILLAGRRSSYICLGAGSKAWEESEKVYGYLSPNDVETKVG